MKKLFTLSDPKKHEDRVFESIKHEIRKYIKREKKKDLLDKKTMYWAFDCKVGQSENDAKVSTEETLMKALDNIRASGAKEIYVEILAKSVEKPLKEEKIVEDRDD